MISQEQIPYVLDHMVLDTEGKKIGEARHVFLDDRTGLPEWVTVRTGMFGSQETFVPIHEARLVEDHLEVPYARTRVKEAPHIDIEEGHLSEHQEHELYDFYGVEWATPAEEQRTPPPESAAAPTEPTTETPPEPAAETPPRSDETGRAGMAAAAGAPDIANGPRGLAARPTPEADTRGGMAAAGLAEPAADRGTAAGERLRTDRGTDGGTDLDAMTRSEERLHVGTERHESGRARLRKYVVTEEVETTVPLRHEEVRIEREPITEANRDQALGGPEIGEAQHEIVLHEDRPVTEVETVPVERVRMVPEEHTEERTIRGRVRRERIDVEGLDAPEAEQSE